MRLSALDQIAPALRPGYLPFEHGTGIVHLGIGAFHRAHQAAATDAALAAAGGDWRIIGVSLRGNGVARALNPQNGLYTLITRGAAGITRGAAGSQARVIGAVAGVIAQDAGAALAAMVAPGCRIVSLTVTEKAYGLDRAARGCDPAHPAVAADLAAPAAPQGVLGLLTRAMALRRATGLAPFTVLCCDNLPENGLLLRGAVVDFARRNGDAGLAGWIAAQVAFPCTVVDRITPASTPATLAEAERLIGVSDLAAVETEPFSQWVIEDHFPQGRPAWEAAGVIFSSNVAGYERMKLRMLNGAHSMLAYTGFLAGHVFVRDVMRDAALASLVQRHLAAAAASLPALPGMDLSRYAKDLTARFANPAIAHEVFQIAMDGTQKLPQRVFASALDAQTQGQELRPFAFATAAWMRYALGRRDDGSRHALRDPREAAITAALREANTAAQIVSSLSGLPDFLPDDLRNDPVWRADVTDCLSGMLNDGMAKAILHEARR